MKLRTQISLLLFLFGLVPLLLAFMVNVPMIFDRIDALYNKAHLENLRASFNDLDQHIARRHEMARLLARMPVPGLFAEGEISEESAAAIAAGQAAYVEWVNQVLFDQLDITQIVFVDNDAQTVFWLDRDSKTQRLEIQDDVKTGLDRPLLEAGRGLPPGAVLTGPIALDLEAASTTPTRYMQLSLLSPLMQPVAPGSEEAGRASPGAIVLYVDVGGLTTAYRGNYWVHDNGEYLALSEDDKAESTAFRDFPGLQDVFSKGELALWRYDGQQILWLPLFRTQKYGPLWVGRSVDPSPIARLQQTIEIRVALVALGLLIVVFVVARFIAVRTERLGNELTEGISSVLEGDAAVKFSWKRPQELQVLGDNLTALADTHARHSRALQDYARELEETNRYKSEFLANVSHELRTPLNSILLLSRMLEENSSASGNEEDARQARVIHSAGSDLKSLIDNILDLSRIEARKMELAPETVVLRDSINDVLELMRPQFEEKHLRLEFEVSGDVPSSIETDGEKLRQVLVNFLSNAVKFTERGGVDVRLAPGSDRQGRLWPVAISVTDTGIGISGDKHETVFEAFKQADGSTSRRFGGTGLGLAISRELAHLMCGHIEVESTPGQGSVFTLFLPAEIEAEPGEPAVSGKAGREAEARTASGLPEADFGGKRVLLVDDDVRNLLALTPLLERWQLDVMAAGDGEEALETLEGDDAFDVVLMDIMMPGMDGLEVTRHMREQPRFSGIPVIALTARAAEEDRRQCLEAGADDCIVKPVEPHDLVQALDRVLAQGREKNVK